jgi:predicted acetyltransferase
MRESTNLGTTMAWTVTAATEQAHGSLLTNLLSLYVHDMSSYFTGITVLPEGRFQYDYAWDDPASKPYVMYADGLPAGFALLAKGSIIDGVADVWDIKEFFVLRALRRQGAGTWLAQTIWNRHPGTWDVRVGQTNTPALSFWPTAIRGHVGECQDGVVKEIHGSPMIWYRFNC